MIFLWFPCYEYAIYIYPSWSVLIIHLSLKVRVCIPARIMPNHIFIPCRWSVVLYLNLLKMRARNCKIWFRQSSCHLHWLCICLISRTQNEHITFMIIYCNAERWWGMVISRPAVMVIHIKLFTNLSISQKTSLQSLYIDTCLWPKSMSQSKGGILVKVCQGGTNMCPILYPTPVTMPIWSTNICYLRTFPILYEAWYAFYNTLQILHGYWLARPRLIVR